MPPDPHSIAISRHSEAGPTRCNVQGYNLNAGCRVPGNPFKGRLVMAANARNAERAAVCFGPLDLPAGIDTFTALLAALYAAPRVAVKLLTENKLGFDRLVTHRLEPEQFDEAIELLRTGEAVKALVLP